MSRGRSESPCPSGSRVSTCAPAAASDFARCSCISAGMSSPGMSSTQRLPSPNSLYARRWPRLVNEGDSARVGRLAAMAGTMGHNRSFRPPALDSAVMGFLTRTAARTMLSGIFIYSGYGMVNNAERYAKQASKVLPMLPDEPMLARAHGITMLAAGSTFALGIFPKLSARILALTLITNTYVGHQFWKAEKPEDRRPQLIHFLKNVGLFGGLLYVSSDKRSHQRDEDSD